MFYNYWITGAKLKKLEKLLNGFIGAPFYDYAHVIYDDLAHHKDWQQNFSVSFNLDFNGRIDSFTLSESY